MGKWYDEESEERSRQAAAAHFQKAKEGWQQITEGLERDSQREHEWNRALDHILANPHVIDMFLESKLDSLLIEAEGRVEHLKGKTSRLGDKQANIRSIAPPKASALFDAITGVGAALVDNEIRKHEQLLRLLEAAKQRRTKAVPQESASDEAARKISEEVRQMNAIVTRLERDCEQAVRENPQQEESIRRRYRKAIDAVLEKS